MNSMAEYRYCLHQDILSVHVPDRDHKECLYVPAGAVVSVDPAQEDDRFVQVHWDSKTVRMFLQDIQERAELI
jgi:glycyl-tRNA synthetase alpha subunit